MVTEGKDRREGGWCVCNCFLKTELYSKLVGLDEKLRGRSREQVVRFSDSLALGSGLGNLASPAWLYFLILG